MTAIVLGILGTIAFLKFAENLKAPELPQELKENYNFKYSTLNGEIKYVADLKGKVIFVNFWGTWCLPCVAEMPSIQQLYDTFKNDSSVVFIIASRLATPEKIKSFAKKHNYNLPFYIVNDKDIPESMNFQQYPTTFIYAKDGSMATKHINAANWANKSVVEFLHKLEKQ